MAHPRRNISKLNQSKAKKISKGVGVPLSSQGADGDLTVRQIKNRGIKLFIKVNGKWWSIPMYADFTKFDDMDRIISTRAAKYDGEIGYGNSEFEFKSAKSSTVSLATSTNMTLNSGGDIEINADGGQVLLRMIQPLISYLIVIIQDLQYMMILM